MNTTQGIMFSDMDALEQEAYLEFTTYMIPILIFLLIVCSVGTVGNIIVLAVYSLRYQSSIYKTFVICLASVDLIGCIVGIPLLLPYVIYPRTQSSPVLCKLTVATGYFSGSSSMLLLDAIAIERYRKVCQSTKTQFTLRGARLMCLFDLLLAVCYIIPVIVTQDVNPYSTRFNNLTGYVCETANDYKNSTFLFVYNLLIIIVYLILLSVCIVLYTFVTRKIKKHYKSQKRAYSVTETTSGGLGVENHQQRVEICSQQLASREIDSNLEVKKETSTGTMDTDNNVTNELTDKASMDKTNLDNTNKDMERKPSRKTLRRKKLKGSRSTTTIFMTVSIISFSSYFPFLVFSVVRKLNFYAMFAKNAGAFIPFLRWMFFVNHFVNPMVYGFMDSKFRNECWKLYTQVKTRVMSIFDNL